MVCWWYSPRNTCGFCFVEALEDFPIVIMQSRLNGASTHDYFESNCASKCVMLHRTSATKIAGSDQSTGTCGQSTQDIFGDNKFLREFKFAIGNLLCFAGSNYFAIGQRLVFCAESVAYNWNYMFVIKRHIVCFSCYSGMQLYHQPKIPYKRAQDFLINFQPVQINR